MRKIALICFTAVLAIALFSGYAFYWFKKAGEFQQMLEQSITSLNEQAKTLDANSTLVRYSAIRASGFPFAMTLEVMNPVVDVPVSALLKRLPPPVPAPAITSAPATPPAPMPDWVEEISYSQSVAFSGNLTGNRFTLTMAGDRVHKSLIDHTLRHTLVSSSATPLICHLTVDHPTYGTPWTMQPVFTNLQTFLAVFRSADCDVREPTLKDAADSAPLYHADVFSASASNQSSGNNSHRLTFALESKNEKATPAFDAIFNDYAQHVYALQGNAAGQHHPLMIPISEYGTQNVKIDIAYDGTTDSADLSDPTMQLRLDLNAFELSNALFTFDLKAHLATSSQGNDRVASIDLHGHSQVSARYDQLIADLYKAVAAPTPPANTVPGAPPAPANPDSPEAMAAALMPKLHDLGNMSVDIDANVKGPNLAATFLKLGEYTINAFDWVATPYGIRLKGHTTVNAQSHMPSGEMVVQCIGCDALVDDLGDYVGRTSAFAAHTQGKEPSFVITKDLLGGVKQFLHGIAENGADKNAHDMAIRLVMKDTGEFTVSGKQIPEVMGLFATSIGAHMPQPAAAPSAGH